MLSKIRSFHIEIINLYQHHALNLSTIASYKSVQQIRRFRFISASKRAIQGYSPQTARKEHHFLDVSKKSEFIGGLSYS